MEKSAITDRFSLFTFGSAPGLGQWLSTKMHPLVLACLVDLGKIHLSKVQLNQLLVVSQAASFSDGFFRYYWRSVPSHTYDVTSVEGYETAWTQEGEQVIFSLDHLRCFLMGSE